MAAEAQRHEFPSYWVFSVITLRGRRREGKVKSRRVGEEGYDILKVPKKEILSILLPPFTDAIKE